MPGVERALFPNFVPSVERAFFPTLGRRNVRFPSQVADRVLAAAPLLESFGNAKTVRNDNSSRFGKFTRLWFRGAALLGSDCETYLLEKSRVVHQAPGERTYHCMYGLAAHSSSLDLSKMRYARDGDLETREIEGVDDKDRHLAAWAALGTCGVDEVARNALAGGLEAVARLGQVAFRGDDAAVVEVGPDLDAGARALGVSASALGEALVSRTVTTAGETIATPRTPAAASSTRDALAKGLYLRCFDWVVERTNEATATFDEDSTACGLLDIFGFERFDVNRFEQLCINYGNEKLQEKFCYDLFRSVKIPPERKSLLRELDAAAKIKKRNGARTWPSDGSAYRSRTSTRPRACPGTPCRFPTRPRRYDCWRGAWASSTC